MRSHKRRARLRTSSAFRRCTSRAIALRGSVAAPPDAAFLARAWAAIARAAADANVTVVLGTERIVDDKPRITTLVIDPDGTWAGFQDKVQLDPSEEPLYVPGAGRQLFRAGALTFGVAICHEGFRYPETVRWSARHGAQVVFHPHFLGGTRSYRPATLRRCPEHVSREGSSLPGRREHLLRGERELRHRRIADHVGRGATRWHRAGVATL